MRGRPIAFLATLLFSFSQAMACVPTASGSRLPLSTMRDVRYEGVVAQTDWYTCGPAAVATLLRYYYGMDVDEQAALKVALDVSEELGLNVETGISALALVRTLEHFGVRTLGYELTAGALADYFRRGGLPVIIHVTQPEQHYVVAVGMVGEYILIADPSWGRRIERWTEYAVDKQFSGVTLVALPSDKQTPLVSSAQRRAVGGMVDTLLHVSSLSREVWWP